MTLSDLMLEPGDPEPPPVTMPPGTDPKPAHLNQFLGQWSFAESVRAQLDLQKTYDDIRRFYDQSAEHGLAERCLEQLNLQRAHNPGQVYGQLQTPVPLSDAFNLPQSMRMPRVVDPLSGTNDAIANLEAEVKKARSHHWTLTPAFLVALAALILAATPYLEDVCTGVVRYWQSIAQLW